MKCPHCQHVNPADSQFCGQCGNSMRSESNPDVNCPSCHHPNPADNAFCGHCGASLHADIDDVHAYLKTELPRVIDRAVDTRLAALTDRETVVTEATAQVIDRAWTWISRFGTVVGLPATIAAAVLTVIVGVLGYIGWDSIEDIQNLRTQAETELSKAQETATETQARAEELAKGFDEVGGQAEELAAKLDDKFEALEDKLKLANEAIKRADMVQANMDHLERELAEANALIRQFEQIAGKLDGAEEVLAKIDTYKTQLDKLPTLETGLAALNEATTGLEARVAAQEKISAAYAEKSFEKKIKLLREAVKLDPESPTAHYELGIIHSQAHDSRAALARFQDATEKDPDSWEYGVTLAYELMRNSEDDAALGHLEGLLHAGHEHPEVYLGLGFGQKLVGNLAMAEANYRRAVEMQPEFAWGYWGLAQVAMARNSLVDANQNITRAVELMPSVPFFRIWQMVIRMRTDGQVPVHTDELGWIDLSEWPGPLIGYLSGTLTEDEVMAETDHAERSVAKDRRCELAYYKAQIQLHHLKQRELGAENLRLAERTCPRDFVEYAGALADLKALGVE